MHFVQAKGILSSGNSMNIYRGCTHGCIYCDARSTCYQFDHSFEEMWPSNATHRNCWSRRCAASAPRA